MTDRGRQRDKYKEKRGDTKILKQMKRNNTLVLWKTQKIVLGKNVLHKNLYATLALVFASSDSGHYKVAS